ncbi:MAG: hypothetical protein JWN50_97 [Parcubacteria group bacterium]|nr:hypothetical protein [Parcubacteria group bacterium]
MRSVNREQGFVGIIILVIVGLALLKYFINFDIFAAADSTQGQQTIGYTGQILRTVWSYISTPVTFVWSQVTVPLLSLFWSTFQSFIHWSQTGAGPSNSIF